MEQRKEEITRRPLYDSRSLHGPVYDLPQDILTTLTPKDVTTEGQEQDENVSPTIATEGVAQSKIDEAVGSKSCSLCGVTFYTVEDQKSHVRSDFHNYNLKQKIRGAKPVSEAEFEKLVGDLDESLSGSDSEDSEDEDEGGRKETTLSSLLKKQAAISSNSNEDEDDIGSRKQKRGSGKPPLIWFTTPTLPKNTYLGVYRAIFTNEEQENEGSLHEIIQKKQLTPKPQIKIPVDSNTGIPLPAAYKEPHIFMCMIGGGHFAAMIVSLTPKQTKNSSTGPLTKEATVLAHKTFHRYTTRRKQGGAQSANDSAKGAAHSAGSSLRRYNEQALTDEVRLLLHDWKPMIDSSTLLFIRATGTTNRRTLFGPYDNQVLRQNDPRIRGFPFSTRRATQNELMRSFVELTRVKILEIDEAALAEAARQSSLAKAAKQQSTQHQQSQQSSQPPKLTEEEETALLHTSQIQSLIRRSKLPALLSYLKNNSLPADFRFAPPESNYHAPTPLHLAASLNSATLVYGLLRKAGADPRVRNGEGRTAFEVCGERGVRDEFRVWRGEVESEGKWDGKWEDTRIPAGITRAEATKRGEREKEEEKRKEVERNKAEDERLAREEEEGKARRFGKVAGGGKGLGVAGGLGLGKVGSAQERREQEMRDMSPEVRMRVERERRARAAEERMRRLGGS
ncbi:ankyrin repeat and zinc finger domain-containing protein [Rutstroemia sp. NJR-2017a WRK4]|nr:ankyrin repeat and zinc finger domain-containing protein [Rutstroemia sp. NJR-2017a WRK4]